MVFMPTQTTVRIIGTAGEVREKRKSVNMILSSIQISEVATSHGIMTAKTKSDRGMEFENGRYNLYHVWLLQNWFMVIDLRIALKIY